MKLTKDKIIVSGVLILLLLFIGIFVFALINYKPNYPIQKQPAPVTEIQKPKEYKINLKYKPTDKIDLSICAYDGEVISSTTVITDAFTIVDNSTDKGIDWYGENLELDGQAPLYKIEIKNNELYITTAFISLYISKDKWEKIPLYGKKYYVENNILKQTNKSLVLNPPQLDQETLKSLEIKIQKYKNSENKYTQNYWEILTALLSLALSGDKEAGLLLESENKYEQYFRITLDGDYGETYHSIAPIYSIYEREKSKNEDKKP